MTSTERCGERNVIVEKRQQEDSRPSDLTKRPDVTKPRDQPPIVPSFINSCSVIRIHGGGTVYFDPVALGKAKK